MPMGGYHCSLMGVSSNFTLLPSFFVVFKEPSVSFSQFEITEAGSVVNSITQRSAYTSSPFMILWVKRKTVLLKLRLSEIKEI